MLVLFPLDVDTYRVVRELATDVAPNRRRQAYAGYDKIIWRRGEAQWCFGGMNFLWCWSSTSRPNCLVAQARELFVSQSISAMTLAIAFKGPCESCFKAQVFTVVFPYAGQIQFFFRGGSSRRHKYER